MKNFGIFVIKPDATNKHDLQIIKDNLNESGFKKVLYFRINNYCQLMKIYREEDIKFKGCDNAEAEIKSCGVALNAYKELYGDSEGILMLIPLGKKKFRDFFDKANNVKRAIRKKIEEDRGYCFAYVDYLTNPQLTKLTQNEYLELKGKDKNNINKAYINGIHLEDYECLENNFCLNFMIEHGVISKTNKIDINEMLQDFQDEKIY